MTVPEANAVMCVDDRVGISQYILPLQPTSMQNWPRASPLKATKRAPSEEAVSKNNITHVLSLEPKSRQVLLLLLVHGLVGVLLVLREFLNQVGVGPVISWWCVVVSVQIDLTHQHHVLASNYEYASWYVGVKSSLLRGAWVVRRDSLGRYEYSLDRRLQDQVRYSPIVNSAPLLPASLKNHTELVPAS